MDLHLFRSTAQPIEAFTASRGAEKLAPDLGPWDYVGAFPEHEAWTHPADRGAVTAGVEINGFFLWDNIGDSAGGERPMQPYQSST